MSCRACFQLGGGGLKWETMDHTLLFKWYCTTDLKVKTGSSIYRSQMQAIGGYIGMFNSIHWYSTGAYFFFQHKTKLSCSSLVNKESSQYNLFGSHIPREFPENWKAFGSHIFWEPLHGKRSCGRRIKRYMTNLLRTLAAQRNICLMPWNIGSYGKSMSLQAELAQTDWLEPIFRNRL